MYKDRIEKFRKLMTEKNIEAALIVSDENRNYLSGFTGDESYSIITQDSASFITDSRYTEQASKQAVDYKVYEYTGSFAEFLGNFVKKLGVKNLGFEEDKLTYATYMLYKSKVNVELVPLNGMVESLRSVKDKSEIDSIRKAASVADKSFDYISKFIKAGMTEKEIALELEFHMRKLGASGLSFDTICASGYRSALPHGEPTDKVVKEGEFLTLDYGCIVDGYCSDMTRTVMVKSCSSRMKEIYNIVLEAENEALKEYRPGVTGAYLDNVARKIITDNGYGENFGHSLGHGVGRYIHELPYVSKRSMQIIKKGMVISDEPGIYIPDFGGVRIEDLVLITEDGCEALSKSPKEITIVG